MPTGAGQILSTVARELGISEDDLLKQGLRSFVERQLREIAEVDFVSCHTLYIPPGPPLSKGGIGARPWPTRSLGSALAGTCRNFCAEV